MKKLILIMTILVTLVTVSFSQSSPDPEFSSRPYILLGDNTLKNFERADVLLDIKVKAMGYGGSEIYNTALSPKSDVRFSKNAIPKIIIKIGVNVDPADIVSLSLGEVKKDRRRFLQSSMALGGKARDVSLYDVPLDFKKIREGIYEIVLPSNIQAGEYAFRPINDGSGNTLVPLSTKVKISCFGID
jgi:hypothetical protein